jgi:hypothetical protein
MPGYIAAGGIAKGAMSWEDEQDRITQEGRLYFAPPETVFSELKEIGRRNLGIYPAAAALRGQSSCDVLRAKNCI